MKIITGDEVLEEIAGEYNPDYGRLNLKNKNGVILPENEKTLLEKIRTSSLTQILTTISSLMIPFAFGYAQNNIDIQSKSDIQTDLFGNFNFSLPNLNQPDSLIINPYTDYNLKQRPSGIFTIVDSVNFKVDVAHHYWSLFAIENEPYKDFYNINPIHILSIYKDNFNLQFGWVGEIASNPAFESHMNNAKIVLGQRVAKQINRWNISYQNDNLELTLGKYGILYPNKEPRIKHTGLLAKYNIGSALGIEDLVAMISLNLGNHFPGEKGPGIMRLEFNGNKSLGENLEIDFNLGFTGYENNNLGNNQVTNDPNSKFNIVDLYLNLKKGNFNLGGFVTNNFSAPNSFTHDAVSYLIKTSFNLTDEIQLCLSHNNLGKNSMYDPHGAFMGPKPGFYYIDLTTMYNKGSFNLGPSITLLKKEPGQGNEDHFGAFTFTLNYLFNKTYKP
jgi:hypothetical protein